MFKIGEFSKLTKISIRMLHYYDEKNILKPSMIDKITGYRYYDVSQTEITQKIVMLRDFDFSLFEIEEILNNWNHEYLTKKMKDKINEKKLNIAKLESDIKIISYVIDNINTDKTTIQNSIIIKSVPAKKVVSLRKTIDNHFDEYLLWQQLNEFVIKNKIDIIEDDSNNIAIYHDDEYKEKQIDVEVCFLVSYIAKDIPPYTYKTLNEIKNIASIMVVGNYNKLYQAYQYFMYWLEEHPNNKISGPSQQICHRDHTNEDNPDKYITEIQIPLNNN